MYVEIYLNILPQFLNFKLFLNYKVFTESFFDFTLLSLKLVSVGIGRVGGSFQIRLI